MLSLSPAGFVTGNSQGVSVISASQAEDCIAFSEAGSKCICVQEVESGQPAKAARVFDPDLEPNVRLEDTDDVVSLQWSSHGKVVVCSTKHSHLLFITRSSKLIFERCPLQFEIHYCPST